MKTSFEPDSACIEEHRRWLNQFAPQHGKNWENLFNTSPEDAMCEAEVRRLLEQNGNAVEPNLQLEGQRRSPDFRCVQQGQVFFVEVTCVSICKATQLTGLSPNPLDNTAFSGIGNLEETIFNEVKSKTPQCSKLGAPALVAVGTFHPMAYLFFSDFHTRNLLFGETAISQNIEGNTGTPLGEAFVSTELRRAPFFKPMKDANIQDARCPVSGILVCGFVSANPRLVLHPTPSYPFAPKLLPKIKVFQLREGYEGGVFQAD